MKKILFWLLALFSCFEIGAQQLWQIQSCNTLSGATYGPMNSVATANATNRTAVIYPASQLIGITQQNLNAIYFERTGTTSMQGTPNFKIYLKETTAADWGTTALDWNTAIEEAVLVYDSNPSVTVGSTAGWKNFPFSTNFIYSGQNNLAVFFEYTNSTASGSVSWNYEYGTPCVDSSNSNTTKYSNNTTGILPESLATSNSRRPMIGFDYVVTCPKPTGLMVSNITSTGADLTWTSGGSETQWEYASVPAGSGLPLTWALVDSNVLTNIPLSPGTSYEIYLRSYCADGDVSVWTSTGSFTTLCTEVTSFFENFDTTATGAASPMPDCWKKFGNGTATINTGSTLPGSAPNRLYMVGNSTATPPTVSNVLLPPVSNLQANTHRLKLKAYALTDNKIIEVGYQTDLSDATTFVLIETINLPNPLPTDAVEFIVTPTNIPANVRNLVIKNRGSGTGATSVYIDDVLWEPIPSCPDISNLAAINHNDSQITMQWTAGAGETAWQYVYTTNASADPSALTPIDIENTTHTISELSASTTYKIWVRSNCGNDDYGVWIGPLEASTLCPAVSDFFENFETTPTGTATSMTPCWNAAGTGAAYITNGAVAPLSPPNRIYMSATTSTQAYIFTPPVNNLQSGSHRLRFKAHGGSANKDLLVGYLTSPLDLSTFILIEEIIGLPTLSAGPQEYIIVPSAIPAGVSRIVFKNAPTQSTANLYIDDVSWEIIPSCSDVSAPVAGNALSSSVQISWLPGGTEDTWDYVYGGTTVTDPSTLTPITVTDEPSTLISGLEPSTTYRVWLRSNCGSDVGLWSEPITITTTCSPVTSFTENFDSSATGSSAPMPSCWTKFGTVGNVYPQTGSVYPGTPPNRLYMNTSAVAVGKAIAVLPPTSNLQAGTHRLKFTAYATVSDKILEVGYFVNSADVNSFVVLESFSINAITPATAEVISIVPDGIPDNIESLVLKISGPVSGATTLYLDDFVWDTIPVCADIVELDIENLTNTSSTLKWVPGDLETAWQYVYGPSSVTDPTTLTPADVSGNSSATITDLTANTSYRYWVRSDCGNGNFGNWSQPFVFITNCDLGTTFTENFEDYAIGSANPLPDCWRRAGNGSIYITNGGAAPSSVPNRLYMNATGIGAATQAFAIMPPVSNLSSETHRLRFKSYATAANRHLEVGFLGDVADVGSFTLLESFDLPSTSAATAQEFIFTPEAIPDGITSLVFRNGGITSGATTLYIDDVIWEPIPDTSPTCVASVVTPSTICGNFANVITWNAASGEVDGYNLRIGSSTGGEEILEDASIGNVTTYSFIGTVNTTYYYTLTPFNASGPATDCAEQSFTTLATGCYCTSVPTGNDNSGITNVELGTANFPTADVTYFDHTANSVVLVQGANSNVKVSFATGYAYATNIWIDFNDDFNFDSSELVFQGQSLSTNPTVLDASFMMPANAALGLHRMRIGTAYSGQAVPNPCYNGSLGVTLDFNVMVSEEDLNANNFNATGFKLYPNPVKDVLHLSYKQDITKVTVFNILGQQVLEQVVNSTQGQINMSNLAAGTYLIKVMADSDNKTETIKVIKQ